MFVSYFQAEEEAAEADKVRKEMGLGEGADDLKQNDPHE